MRKAAGRIGDLIAAIEPFDDRERADQQQCLVWLAATDDIYRRKKPATPPQHLVCYVVPVDVCAGSVFLVDHRLAGLWLPPGGHVEPGEDPAATARREAREELGIDADFAVAGARPFFLTMARTSEVAGPAASDDDRASFRAHTDVSLWYVLAGHEAMPLALDQREFDGGRWWTWAAVSAADPAGFEPGLRRFRAKLRAFSQARLPSR
jgi:8-oxo-dGTP diphosphatase